ncbi:GyrI-like domain-containing protein [Nocardia sp. NPDC003345]
MQYPVGIDESAPHTVLAVRTGIRAEQAGEAIGHGLAGLYGLARDLAPIPVGPPRTTYHSDFRPGTTTQVEFELPVAFSPGLGDEDAGFTVRRTEARRYAHTSHPGPYAGIGAAYRALDRWIADSGLDATGPPTEVYHRAPPDVIAPADLLTEVRIPVAATVLAVRSPASFDTTARAARAALRDHDFDLVAEIELRADHDDDQAPESGPHLLLIGFDRDLARHLLRTGVRLAPYLPCTVIVRSAGSGTVVETADPAVLAPPHGEQDGSGTAAAIRVRLEAVLRTVAEAPGDLRPGIQGPMDSTGHPVHPYA